MCLEHSGHRTVLLLNSCLHTLLHINFITVSVFPKQQLDGSQYPLNASLVLSQLDLLHIHLKLQFTTTLTVFKYLLYFPLGFVILSVFLPYETELPPFSVLALDNRGNKLCLEEGCSSLILAQVRTRVLLP